MRLIKLFTLLTFVVTCFSCAPKFIQQSTEKTRLERKKTAELVHNLDSLSQLRPHYFYSKIKCNFKDTNQSVSFKANLRMVKDSAINTLITFAAIPIMNALVRPDSVIISNKRQKCVIRQNVGFIKQQFGVELDFKNVEELFLGLPIGFDTTQKYFQLHDPFQYIISSHKKRAIRRELKGKPDRIIRREEKKDDDVILNYYLTSNAKNIEKITIESPNDTTSITINYIERDSSYSLLVPKEVELKVVTPRNQLYISLSYDKTEIDVLDPIHFVIPEEYEECKND